LIHLTGRYDVDSVTARYDASGVDAEVHAFLEDMKSAYGRCTFAVARAGASTCMELAAWGVPALFVPLPEARRDHQTANAQAVVDAGGADMISQAELSAERLAAHLAQVLYDPDRLDRMCRAMRSMAVTDGAARLADLVVRTASGEVAAQGE
jgi:UDP-N-acetylglucosamine--N-acetylmuramyl-(pentapeptide) pyrophosphoryl-undecaprenol N-acetylglucosamine transferase